MKICAFVLALCFVFAGFPVEINAKTESGTEDEIYAKVYRFGKKEEKKIALTFDDGPHPLYTPKILKILEKYQIKATFFMIGENVKNYTEVARMVVGSGHEIGNHTFSHKVTAKLSELEIRNEIYECDKVLLSLLGVTTSVIRPPAGNIIGPLLRVCGEIEYSVILWNIDTMDWAHKSPSAIYDNVMKNIDSGDIILMHDYIGKKSPTPEALERIIPVLVEMGYEFVTVSELIGL